MASRYWGVNPGGNKVDVAESSSTTSKKVEIVYDITAAMTKADVLIAIDYIKEAILEDVWQPA